MSDLPQRQRVVVDQYVIYWNPSDYPQQYVVRRWEIGAGWIKPAAEAQVFDMLEEARMAVPETHDARLNRAPGDDPTIVEVWV